MNPQILIADDHQMLRDGLRKLLEADPGGAVSEAEDGRTAVRMAAEGSPDVVVMDVSMPDLNGIDATRQIMATNPQTKVVVLSAHSDARSVRQALDAGAKGYVPKDAAYDELAGAIRAVMADQVYLSPRIASAVVHPVDAGAPTNGSGGKRPSPREREVLQLMAEGKATKEIAAILHVSVKTVETHRRQLMEKLDLHSVAELTKYAVREGITSLER
jgi:DNA-binding NarL/FixJ family response regulator